MVMSVTLKGQIQIMQLSQSYNSKTMRDRHKSNSGYTLLKPAHVLAEMSYCVSDALVLTISQNTGPFWESCQTQSYYHCNSKSTFPAVNAQEVDLLDLD